MPTEEKLIRITALLFRKEGTTPEEFYHHWYEVHGPKMLDLSLRYGVVEYRQYHTTPEAKATLDVVAKAFGKDCLPCDGMAETLVRDLGTYLRMQADSEYLEKIVPDEAAFMDKSKLEFTIGYEYAVIENGKAVVKVAKD
ncbi:hypothetical protein EYB26_003093 [Talaromyces marneffei]|uniref:uncharacterized protein n=1 Tax=Talaromyces marneffei TaxID=37727 RepID=UPI0012AA4A63|nr:uncharacterized protein EYB26_003093 [Talaromyces marneffei]QGA15435.1 hypothetical protein EYB26_003093 [Talaromyces marneffei]